MKKVIIIGAGPAGITAGYELLKNRDGSDETYEVLILEQSDAIGGISRTVRHNGNRMDIGGHRFFSKDSNVTDWWSEIMPKQGAPAMDDKILGRSVPVTPGGPDPDQEDRVMLTRNRVSRIYYKKKFFDYPVKMNWNTIHNMGFLTTMNAGFSYLYSAVCKKDEDSLENFYINRFGKKLYSMFFEGYTEKLWGRHPRDISADWGAQRVKGLSIVAILKDILQKALPQTKKNAHVETSLIEEFQYPKFGPGQLWETAAQEFVDMGGEIRKGCKVVEVHTEGNAVKELVYEQDGQKYTVAADCYISSMPLKDLVAGMNDVPADIGRIAAGLPYRDFVTVGLCVRNHWQNLPEKPRNRETAEALLKQKEYFANFIAGHESEFNIRGDFFKKLCGYKRVESPGSYLNNMPDGKVVSFENESKVDFQRKCKFTLCFESTNHYGFVTEKIMDAFYADTVLGGGVIEPFPEK